MHARADHDGGDIVFLNGSHRESVVRWVWMAGILLLLIGCVRGSTSKRSPMHPNPNMDLQPKYRPQAESAFFYDGATMRLPVEGTVARGELRQDMGYFEGYRLAEDGSQIFAATVPMAVDAKLLARGEERYAIYCTPCHGENGNGRGPFYDRSQIEAADLIGDERIRNLSPGEFFSSITNGVGLMAGYRYPVPTEDRWAIVAYVRQLQQQLAPQDPPSAAPAEGGEPAS